MFPEDRRLPVAANALEHYNFLVELQHLFMSEMKRIGDRIKKLSEKKNVVKRNFATT